MAIKRTLELNVSKGATKEEVQKFLDLIPDGAAFSTNISHILADRPWEQDSYTMSLLAEWSE